MRVCVWRSECVIHPSTAAGFCHFYKRLRANSSDAPASVVT